MIHAGYITDKMEEWAPAALAEEWDNCGLLIGDRWDTANKVLVALDVTEEVVTEAVEGKFDFIISHHPLIYNPIKRVTTSDATGRKILTLIKHGIGCYCAHTNLDKAIGGVNDCLAEKLNIKNLSMLIEEDGSPGIGRVGDLPREMTFTQLAAYVKNTLKLPEIRYAGDPEATVKIVGLCGGDGSGTRYLNAAAEKKCDAYITGDLRHHSIQDALEMNLNLLDITHHSGEALIIEAIVNRLHPLGINIHATKTTGQILFTM